MPSYPHVSAPDTKCLAEEPTWFSSSAVDLFLDQAHWQELAGTLTPGVVVSNRELRWRRDDGAPLRVLATLREADGFLEGVAIAAVASDLV